MFDYMLYHIYNFKKGGVKMSKEELERVLLEVLLENRSLRKKIDDLEKLKDFWCDRALEVEEIRKGGEEQND